MLTKQLIITALSTFIRQRPGLDFGNYADVKAYQSELRSITRDLHDARHLLRSVELRDSITAEDLLAAFKRAYSGRLTISETEDGRARLEYCTGQYWPTEYRKAVAAVCASALWDYTRECMPEPTGKVTRNGFEHDSIKGLTPGDWLRREFRREYGRGIQSRWFN